MKILRLLGWVPGKVFIPLTLTMLSLGACVSTQTLRPDASMIAISEEQLLQEQFVLETELADIKRLNNVAGRLARANAEFCSLKDTKIGILPRSLSDFQPRVRGFVQSAWGISDTPTLLIVDESSPAALAGLQARDEILGINGKAVGPDSKQTLSVLADAVKAGEVSMTVRRNSEEIAVRVTPAQVCGYDFQLVNDSELNASADGKTIRVNKGMLRFVQNDDELALVLGHELAHNAMSHINAQQQNATAGAVGGFLLDVLAAAAGVNTQGAFTEAGGQAGAAAFSQDFESEADYVGMYFAARAGYKTDGVAQFWRRMAVESPVSIRFGNTHPTTAERFVRLEAANNELAQKRASGMSLAPNLVKK